MPRVLDPIQFVIIALADWMNHRQLRTIEYLREENRVLREQLGSRRVRFNDNQRRRLAAKAKGLGRKLLAEVAPSLHQRPCWRGIENLLLINMVAAHNAVAERFVRSIKESCLDRLILFGEESLRKAIQNFLLHYHAERNHQGRGNKLLFPRAAEFPERGIVRCQERLGGLLKYYHREAA
jgi:hypothetical protein